MKSVYPFPQSVLYLDFIIRLATDECMCMKFVVEPFYKCTEVISMKFICIVCLSDLMQSY